MIKKYEGQTKIQMDDLATGLYYLVVQTNEDKKVYKLLINR